MSARGLARVGRVRRVAGTSGAWRRVAARVARAREAETSAGAW